MGQIIAEWSAIIGLIVIVLSVVFTGSYILIKSAGAVISKWLAKRGKNETREFDVKTGIEKVSYN